MCVSVNVSEVCVAARVVPTLVRCVSLQQLPFKPKRCALANVLSVVLPQVPPNRFTVKHINHKHQLKLFTHLSTTLKG